MEGDAVRWLAVGEEALESAVMLNNAAHWRSTLSRAYFAGYAFVHAAAIDAGLATPDRGNWAHQRLIGDALDGVFRRRRSAAWRRKLIRRNLGELQTARVFADYGPQARIGAADAEKAIESAGRLRFFATGGR